MVGTQELAHIQCDITWAPPHHLTFVWSRLSDLGERQELEEVGSVLRYPGSQGETLLECRARDGGELYGQPCTYQIIITGSEAKLLMESFLSPQ